MEESNHTSPRVSFEFFFNPEAAPEPQNDIVFCGKQIVKLSDPQPEEHRFAADLRGLFPSTSGPLLGATRKRNNGLKSVKRVNSSPPSSGIFRYRSSWRKQRVSSFVGLAPKMDLRMELDDLRRRQLRKNPMLLPAADAGKQLADCGGRRGGMLRCGARLAGVLAMRASLALSCISPAS